LLNTTSSSALAGTVNKRITVAANRIDILIWGILDLLFIVLLFIVL